jgi:hypothetical protein
LAAAFAVFVVALPELGELTPRLPTFDCGLTLGELQAAAAKTNAHVATIMNNKTNLLAFIFKFPLLIFAFKLYGMIRIFPGL